MLIDKVALRNFKCFRDVDIELSKITLLTGENSSGKSSFLYGLLAAFQSVEFPLFLSPNGKYVNMGDFEDIAFNNITESEIGFDISIKDQDSNQYNVTSNWAIDHPNNKMPKLKHLRAETDFVNFQIEAKKNSYVLDFSYDHELFLSRKQNEVELNKAIYSFLEAIDKIASNGDEEPETNIQQKIRRSFLEVENVKNFKFESQDQLLRNLVESGYPGAARIMAQFIGIFGNIDNNLNFISSFRLQPERTYYQKTRLNDKVGRSGENYIDQILEWENKKAPEFKMLKTILDDLNLVHTLKSKKLKGGRFEFRVQIKSKGVLASLADVGFGISQFLPIIVADLQLSQKSTLVVAQPEIHLHPSVQARLADYFIGQVNNSAKRYILETHSEYLLNRVRLSIAKGEIEPSDLSIYYFENSIDGSIQHRIEFTKDGQINNAPEGFFDTYMMDVMDIALHV